MLTHRHRTILGDIPADWDAKPLKSLITEHFAGDWGSDEGEHAVAVLRSTNFTDDGQLDFSDIAQRFFSKDQAGQFGLLKGDLLVERSGGGPEQPVGRIGFIERDMPGSTVSNFVQVLRPDPDKGDAEYLGWLLFELQRTGIVERVQQQSTQMRNLNWRDYQKLMLPWPRIDEQHRIAVALRVVSDAIGKTQAELAAMRETRRALMSSVFERGLTRTSEVKHCKIHRCFTAQIPIGWEDEKLGRSLELVEYGTNAPSNDYRGGYPVIAIPQVVAPHLSLTDVPFDDVLLIRTNGNPEYIGRSTIVSAEVAEVHTIYASYLIRVRPKKDKVLGAYLNYFLASPLGRRQAGAAANTSAGNNNIGARAIKQFRFPRPPLPEQQEIVSILDAAERQIDALTKKLLAAGNVKRSLLQNLLTGKVRIPEGAIHA
jgi:type I restriction enzyme S subunit